MIRSHIVCKAHNLVVMVGPGSLLSEYECPTCLDAPPATPTDPEALFISRITSHYNGNCCCNTCEPDYCYTCGHFAQFCTCLYVELTSPNYCDGSCRTLADVPF